MAGDKHNVQGTLAYAQRIAIEEALRGCGYNLSQAAKRLQIGRTTLYKLMEKYESDGAEPGRGLHSRGPETATNDAREVYYIDGIWYLRSPMASLT